MGIYMYPPSIRRLIDALSRLPGIGPKNAQRLAFHLLNTKEAEATELSRAIIDARAKVKRCQICGNLTDETTCSVCRDSSRSRNTICVVEQPGDAIVMEKTGEYRGLYHVLHGALSPMEGIGPNELNIKPLLERLKDGSVKEVVMATNTGVEGEATAMYLARLIKPLNIKVSRLAHGMPVGNDLEYTDEATLARALIGRKEL